jgi:hypothetical protein
MILVNQSQTLQTREEVFVLLRVGLAAYCIQVLDLVEKQIW